MSAINGMLKTYLDNLFKVNANTELELEAKFGTRGIKPIGRIEYGNVIQRLLSHGFTPVGANKYLLRIQNEYTDISTGTVRLSNLRTEINGLHHIQTYCKTNRLDGITENGLNFLQKESFKLQKQQQQQSFYPVNVDDYNFRLTLSTEKSLNTGAILVKDTVEKWNDTKKTFRYLNRYSLMHRDFPFIVDVSIVKESKKQGNNYIPEYTFQDSGVLNSSERYEIELECSNRMVGIGTRFSTPELLQKALNQIVKYVLSGLQETSFPVAYSEQRMVMYEYMDLLWHRQDKEKKKLTLKEKEQEAQKLRVLPKNFVGPSSYTLQLENVMPVNSDSLVPNIRVNYTVTDKADGDRKLLYVAPDTGKIYLINTNMSIQFTGAVTRNKDLFNTLIDGEHILYNKERQFINLYTAFDIYYIRGENVRMKPFIPTSGAGTSAAGTSASATGTGTSAAADEQSSNLSKLDILTNFRLPLLVNVIKKLSPESVVKSQMQATPSPLRIEVKTFYSTDDKQTIFQGCDLILQKLSDGLFEYNTDGLIFTPANLGVGANKVGEVVKPLKSTWNYSFKWKPVEQNTIDFLISIKKQENGSDYIGNIFEAGMDLKQAAQLTQYKTVILRVGFEEGKHGYLNPCQNVIEDKLPEFAGDLDDEDNYKPLQFYPTQPSDPQAGITNIVLENNRNDEKVMLTEAKEEIEDNMIIECSYDKTKEANWRWKPLRVRYDKTAELRAGIKNFGNAYHVANSNWHTIHNPITEEMITTGLNIPTEIMGDDDVYYNRTSTKTNTRALRDFHNRFVKKSLLMSVAKRGDTLIDLAVGKGGDFPKWINAKLRFVFGIDISRDNIHNRFDGACARYLNSKKDFKNIPDALFVHGNSSVNIRSGNALYSEKDKQITKAVFGEGPKDATVLGKGVYKEYGIAKDGFDICSIQFAIHYMFENNETLNNFLRNVSEVTKVGGYFIGTSYDGKILFNMLKHVKTDEAVTIMSDGTKDDSSKIWEVTKRYKRSEFIDDVSCLGYGIDVYQESINKVFREYLVNYDYLTQLLENYGFVLLSKEELKGATISESTGLFPDLFTRMNGDIKRNAKLAADYKEAPNMTAGERQISFLNRYFIYKKVRKVDTENVFLGLTNTTLAEAQLAADETKRAQEDVLQVQNVPVPAQVFKVKGKLKTTIKLVESL